MLQVYTGNGKGKTTAAIGLAVRAVGAGKKVGWIYFDKGGDQQQERKVFLDKFKGLIDFEKTGLDRIDPVTGRFRFGVTSEDVIEAERGLALAREWIMSGNYDLIILDEINSTVDLGMLKKEAVLELLEKSDRRVHQRRIRSWLKTSTKNGLELVFTGRNAPPEFLDNADLVTEMTLVKHYFYRGVRAREGFDY